jgi:hypothetical protein
MLNFGFWILDFGFWILDFGFWIEEWLRDAFLSFIHHPSSFLRNPEIPCLLKKQG